MCNNIGLKEQTIICERVRKDLDPSVKEDNFWKNILYIVSITLDNSEYKSVSFIIPALTKPVGNLFHNSHAFSY